MRRHHLTDEAAPRRARPVLEALEDRTLPAVYFVVPAAQANKLSTTS